MCRQLGYPGAVRVGSYRSSTNQIWLDDVQCTGNETSIDQCSHNGFNIYDCNFDTDQVGVECIGQFYISCAIYISTLLMQLSLKICNSYTMRMSNLPDIHTQSPRSGIILHEMHENIYIWLSYIFVMKGRLYKAVSEEWLNRFW